MSCVVLLALKAIAASFCTPSGVKASSTPSVLNSATYWRASAFFGSVRMRTKSASVSEVSATRTGKRPCSSGISSLGLWKWNAPAARNSMWSLRTWP